MSELLAPDILMSIITAAMGVATVILLAALGELVTERSGIWNMGVEGAMLFGCLIAYLVMAETGSPVLAAMAAMASGLAAGLLIGVMTVTLRVDHFVTGLGFNLLASGLTLFWFRSYVGGGKPPSYSTINEFPVPLLSEIPVIGPILFDQHLLTYAAFLSVPFIAFFLRRTTYGLETRAAGENPQFLEAKGLSVATRQYSALLFGSALTALGGAFLMMAFADQFRPDISGGRGWLAIVAVIAGNWRPVRTMIAVLIFAFLDSAAVHAQGVGVDIPYQFFLMLPYVASILLLVMIRSRSGQPAKLGVPYLKH
ncbi:ABC transporter permease [Leisingera sp. McT4-56]|uniref:ABC transporter permease n=1 Tax=Leisingera sp. McT4-56 TaxID=2881255 RepID=UPI001CF8B3C9|nr:ABC transporter permease [Leisingera sp. McT4-56]MCB4454606.1 ABC transporter permease [Leisingera sp. McT4-56]